MKKLIKILLVLLVLVIIAVVGLTLALPSLINLEKVRVLAEEKATEALGRQVSISDTSITLWGGPRVKLRGLSIAESEKFGEEPFASLGSFDLSVRFWPLFRRKVEVEHIILVQPRFRIIRNSKALWNWADMVPESETPSQSEGKLTSKKPDKEKGPVSTGQVAMLVKDIRITDGEVFFSDGTNERLKKGLRIMGINLELRDVSLDRPISILASAGLNRKESDFSFIGKVGPVGKKLDPQSIVFDITLDAPAFELERIRGLAGPLPFSLSGKISSKRVIKGSMASGIAFDHTASLDGLNVTSRDGTPLVRNFSGATRQKGFMDIRNKTIRFDDFTVEIDRARLSASGTVKNPGPKAVIDFRINSDPVPLDNWDRIFPSMGGIATLAGDITVTGTLRGRYGKDLVAEVDLSSNNFELDRGPALLKEDRREISTGEAAGGEAVQEFKPVKPSPITFAGRVSVARGRFEKVKFSDLGAVMSFKGTRFTLDKMGFSAFGGQMSGSAWADLGSSSPAFGSSMKMSGVQINDAVSAFTKLGGTIYGKASSDMDISGKGSVFEDIKRSLTGRGSMNVGEGRLTNTNLLKGAGGAASLLGLGAGNDETKFDAVKAEFTIGDERVNVSNAVISTADWALSISGYIGLDRSLNMKSGMALSDRLASIIPANKRDLFPRDASGRLQIPMKVRGTVTSPRFTLDTAVMGKAAVEAEKKKLEKVIEKKQDEFRKKLEKDIGDSLKKLFR